jgi:hypothetical protein
MPGLGAVARIRGGGIAAVSGCVWAAAGVEGLSVGTQECIVGAPTGDGWRFQG